MSGVAPLFDLSGRVAVVTGGNGGIGRSIALGLARAGASVAVLARNVEKNRLVLAELQTVGAPALVLQLDVTDRTALAPTMAQVERELGGVDILVNNAGIAASSGGVLNETAENWDATVETHLNACFAFAVCCEVNGQPQEGQDYQPCEHVLVLRVGPRTFVQRGKGRCRAADKVHGNRTRPSQHPSQCNRSRMDRNGPDSHGPQFTDE